MPTYEFACTPCFDRGVVSTWEMVFKVDDPKNSFCPKCGSPGKQVILTAPMISTGGNRQRFNEADRLTERALDETGGYKGIRRTIEDMGGQPPPQAAPDPMKPRWGNPADILGQASAATAATRAEGNPTGNDARERLSKVVPSEVSVHPADAAKGRVPTNGVKLN